MVDLHTHILPDMDDGPRSCEESLRLIKMEIENGVDTLALTPHFNPEYDNLPEFLQKRQQRTELLKSACSSSGLRIRLLKAAEVRLVPELAVLPDLRALCYEKSGFLLTELPMDYFYAWIPEALFQLRLHGITPVIAHAERYPYFLKKPGLLMNLANSGLMVQINAGSIVSSGFRRRRFVYRLIRQRACHIIATDTHSVGVRPPKLKRAMTIIKRKFGEDTVLFFDGNCRMITGAAEDSFSEPTGMTKEKQRGRFRSPKGKA